MTADAARLASISPDGCCGGIVSDTLLVLACSLSPGHDEGFERSRGLARSFCDHVIRVATREALDKDLLAEVSQQLLSSPRWSGWYLSFCVVERREGWIRAFSCGVCGLACVSADRTVCELLAPQTLGRKLRREGVTRIPPSMEYVASAMAGKDLLAHDIEEAALESRYCATLLAIADPRLMELLPSLGIEYMSLNSILVKLQAVLDAMNNPSRSFVLSVAAAG
jgi:hypothetical protein